MVRHSEMNIFVVECFLFFFLIPKKEMCECVRDVFRVARNVRLLKSINASIAQSVHSIRMREKCVDSIACCCADKTQMNFVDE